MAQKPEPSELPRAPLPVGRYHPAGGAYALESDGQQVRLEVGGKSVVLEPTSDPSDSFTGKVPTGSRFPGRRKAGVIAEFEPSGDVKLSGDYFDRSGQAPAVLEGRARAPFVGSPAAAKDYPNLGFIAWAQRQIATVPEVRAVFDDVYIELRSRKEGRTVSDVLELALNAAWVRIGGDPGVSRDARVQDLAWPRTVVTAFVALGSHALPMPGNASQLLPEYLPDGRGASNDKARHVFSQGMFAAVTLFDERFGTGCVARAFNAVVDRMDVAGRAALVDEAYERNRAEMGPLIGPRLENAPPGPYVPQPEGLDPVAQRVWSQAVRMGAAYEHLSTKPPHATYDVRELQGERPPVAEIPAYSLASNSGLIDAGVTYDLSANRIGIGAAIAELSGERAVFPFEGTREFATLPPRSDSSAVS